MGMRIAADPRPMNMGCSSLTPWRPPPRRCSFPPTRSFRSRMRRRTARPPHPARDTPTDIRRPGARILVDDRKERAFASRLIRCKTKGRNAPKTGHSKRACNRLPLAACRPMDGVRRRTHPFDPMRTGPASIDGSRCSLWRLSAIGNLDVTRAAFHGQTRRAENVGGAVPPATIRITLRV